MELVHIKGNTWYLKAAELIPVYRLDEHRCILLDSGNNWERDALREVLEREKLDPIGVFGTHFHPDHLGNHRWLQQEYGTKICMPEGEAGLVSSIYAYKTMYEGVSFRSMEKLGRDLVFRSDRVVRPEEERVEFMGVCFRVHHTPGHSPDHVCIGTPDGVCYIGDLLMTDQVLNNAQLPYHLIHEFARESMKAMAKETEYDFYIAAHSEILTALGPAVEKNLARLDWVCGHILALMEEPISWDQLMREVLSRNQLYTSESQRVAGFGYSTQAFLDYLKDMGQLREIVEDGVCRFRRIQG